MATEIIQINQILTALTHLIVVLKVFVQDKNQKIRQRILKFQQLKVTRNSFKMLYLKPLTEMKWIKCENIFLLYLLNLKKLGNLTSEIKISVPRSFTQFITTTMKWLTFYLIKALRLFTLMIRIEQYFIMLALLV